MRTEFVEQCLAEVPFVAIMRGVLPDEVVPIGDALHQAGFKVMEVTLNSERPLESIRLLAEAFEEKMAVGAGTVTSPDEVESVFEAGAGFVVSPSVHAGVIAETKRLGMYSLPGAMTPTECFDAIHAGADGLKIFPASVLGPSGLSGVMAVIPNEVPVFAVGGVTTENLGEWFEAGAGGVGLGSNIYHKGDSAAQVLEKASVMLAAYQKLKQG